MGGAANLATSSKTVPASDRTLKLVGHNGPTSTEAVDREATTLGAAPAELERSYRRFPPHHPPQTSVPLDTCLGTGCSLAAALLGKSEP